MVERMAVSFGTDASPPASQPRRTGTVSNPTDEFFALAALPEGRFTPFY
jgi:hypothetical protein